MNNDKLGKTLLATSIAVTVITSHVMPTMAEEAGSGNYGASQTEQAADQEKGEKQTERSEDTSRPAEQPVHEEAAVYEEKQGKAGPGVTVNGNTITITGSQDENAPYQLTAADMAVLANLTGKTIEINDFVLFPNSITLDQTHIRGLNNGNDGVWFADEATQGFIVNNSGSTIEDLWIHGRLTVSNADLTLKSEVYAMGGTDASPSVVLNNGSIAYPAAQGGFADLYVSNGLTSDGTSSMTLSNLSFQNGGANNAIQINNGSLNVGPMQSLELQGSNAAFGIKAADGASATFANCTQISMENTASPNFTGVLLGNGSSFNTVDSFLAIHTNAGTAFSGAANSTINMETSNFKTFGTVSGGLLKGSALNFNNANFEVIGITGWENNPTTGTMNFTNADVAFQGSLRNGSMGCHLGADMTLTNSSFETTGGSQIADMTGINLTNGATLNVRNSNVHVNAVYGASVKGDGSFVIDNEGDQAVQLDGTNNYGRNIQLGAGKFIIKNGYVFVDGNTSLTYDQYMAGDTHPGMDNDAVNANGEEIYPFVIEGGKENEITTLNLVDGQGQPYKYTYSVQKDTLTLPQGTRAYVWGPVATVSFFGKGTLDGKPLSDTVAMPYKHLFLRSTDPVTLPKAALANKTFAGWRPKDDPDAAPSKDQALSKDTNDLIAVYDARKTAVTLRYVDATGQEIGITKKPIDVAEDHPEITLDQVKAELPAYYKLQKDSPITLKTDDFNNRAKTVNVTVVPVQWTITLNYTDNGKTVGTKDVKVVPANGLNIDEKTIQAGVPANYELVTSGAVSFKADKETVDVPVRPVKAAVQNWNVSVEYADGNKTVGTYKATVKSNNAVISAADIEKNVPKGYELASKAADVTFKADNETQTVAVKAVAVLPAVQSWKVSVQYMSGKDIIKTVEAKVKSNDPVVSAADIEKNVPQGYELVSKVSDIKFAKDGDIQKIEVKKAAAPAAEWSVELTFKDKTSHKTVGQANIKVASDNLKLTAAQIKAAVPEGYALVKEPADTTLNKDLFKNGKTGLIFTVEKKIDSKKTASTAATSVSTNTLAWAGLCLVASIVIGAIVSAFERKK